MPGGATKLEVYNLAIDVIKDTALQSTSDPSATAKWMNRNYDQIVKELLRAYPWNFAKKFVSLSAEAEAPEHTWTYSYKPTPGWLRVLPIRRGGNRFGTLVPYEVAGNRIYTNEAAPLKVVLIMDKTANPGEWDPLFVRMVSASLALGMANKFTSKNKFIELASQMLTNARALAEQIDSFEGSPEPIESFDIIRARGSDENITQFWR
jgi:hypothetical protein